MKERPLIVTTELIPKILDGTKTQTRRVIKPQPRYHPAPVYEWKGNPYSPDWFIKLCPYGQVGDSLYIKEAFAQDGDRRIYYKLDYPDEEIPFDLAYPGCRAFANWRSPIFMPRWASRITLEITGIRVERLQEIRTEDIMAEGLESTIPYQGFVHRFKKPWVWVIQFKREMPGAN